MRTACSLVIGLMVGALAFAPLRARADDATADFDARLQAAIAAAEDAPLRALHDDVSAGKLSADDAARVEDAWASRLEARGDDADGRLLGR